MRATYKVAATETGRWACEKYVDGTGVNSQTFPREAIEIPDDLENFVATKVNVEVPAEEEENDEEET
jgi:hypothetical protein